MGTCMMSPSALVFCLTFNFITKKWGSSELQIRVEGGIIYHPFDMWSIKIHGSTLASKFWIWWPSEVLTIELEYRTHRILKKNQIFLKNLQRALKS